MSTLKHKSATPFPDLERITDPEVKKVLSDLFKTLSGSLTDIYDDANAVVQWEVDGTETQLVTADEVDMQSKKIINVTDPTAAQDAATKAYSDLAAGFVSGDLIISTVTTARTGWTNVSATYANKFMRINATPLTTGGSDTHTHSLAEANLPSHTHGAGTLAADSGGAHTHTVPSATGGASSSNLNKLGTAGVGTTNTSSDGAHTHTISGSTAAVGSGTAFSGDNVPAYVQVTAFKKD